MTLSFFTLGVSTRSHRQELWQIEKSIIFLQQLDQEGHPALACSSPRLSQTPWRVWKIVNTLLRQAAGLYETLAFHCDLSSRRKKRLEECLHPHYRRIYHQHPLATSSTRMTGLSLYERCFCPKRAYPVTCAHPDLHRS